MLRAAQRAGLAVALALCAAGCATAPAVRRGREPPPAAARVVTLEATGYCPCGACCGWHRNCLFTPVYSGGPLRGRRKEVGVTASGTAARRGTIAADTALFPFGTRLFVPGYGYGRVEDRGGDIKGARLDLFFPTHAEAVRWGRRRVNVHVWPPGSGE
jgi:3D (Asp-Asp-Asp) domain-containing protein